MIRDNRNIIDGIIERRKASKLYRNMVESDKYYHIDNTVIMNAKREMVISEEVTYTDDEGNVTTHDSYRTVEDYSKSNFKLPHGFHYELVNQCVNFLTGRPIRLSWQKDTPSDELKSTINDVLRDKNSWGKFNQDMTRNAQRYSVAWARVSLDKDGDIRYDVVDSKNIDEFTDEYNDIELITYERVMTEYDEKGQVQLVTYFDVYDDMYRDTYVLRNGWEEYKVDVPLLAKNVTAGSETSQEAISWGKPPFIRWKGSDDDMTSLEPIKPFVDMLDITLSHWANDIEDIQEMVWILKGYGGQDISEFMSDLKHKKAINVGEGGDVSTERSELPYKARQELAILLTRNIYRFGRGIDFTDRSNLGNITGTGLKWSYELLEEKANEIEINGQQALDDLFRFIFKYLEIKGINDGHEFNVNNLDFIFDRSLMINEQENVDTALKFSTFGSMKTALEHTDWVTDVDEELKQIQEEGGVSDVGRFEPLEDEEESIETVEVIDEPSRDTV